MAFVVKEKFNLTTGAQTSCLLMSRRRVTSFIKFNIGFDKIFFRTSCSLQTRCLRFRLKVFLFPFNLSGTQNSDLPTIFLPFVLCLLLFAFPASCFAQSAEKSAACVFVKEKFVFEGDAVEQARCLLRPVKMFGELGEELEKLPEPLEKLIGNKIKIDKKKLREYLQKHNIKEEEIGGSLDAKLSIAKLSSRKKVYANYFLIHDVSTPNYLENDFPEDINDETWALNDLQKLWKNTKVAHLFINRLGSSITTVDFSSTLPEKSFGTKFARDFLKADAKGLQIHVELIQPRKSEPTGAKGNDGIAPTPGFTQAQYDRLALVYLAASIRRGKWLIPSFHAAMDAGIPNAHDDPQNFDLEQWAKSLASLLAVLR